MSDSQISDQILAKYWPSRPDPTACADCGELQEPVLVGAGDFRRWLPVELCSRCKVHRNYAAAARIAREKRREKRLEYVAAVRKQLEAIPPLYRTARLSRLPAALQKTLRSPESCYLWGGVGVGKTFAAIAALRTAAVSGKTVRRAVYENLLAELRRFAKSEDSILLPYLEADVLLLDDIGLSGTDYVRRILFRLIDTRLEQRRKTLLTGNLSLENLREAVGERIASRLQLFTILCLDGRDRRSKK